MEQKLQVLAEKVEKIIERLDSYGRENRSLKTENDNLKAELARIQKDCKSLKLGKSDRTEAVRTKLQTVLSRLEELESLQS